jgi:uncharacterized membrane protein YoaK (UPF0700 family)
MTFLAGATDVYGLAVLHNLFVSFMSGNTTMPGVSLGSGDFARSASIAPLIGLFVLGASGGAALNWTVFAFVSAMGSLNAAINKVGAASVSLTFVTGMLVKFGQGLGNWVTGRRADTSWLLQVPMWTSLLAGSCCAALIRHLGVVRPWPLPLIGLLLAMMAFVVRPFLAALPEPIPQP